MTPEEENLIRYALAYLAFRDGRVARGWTSNNMSPQLMKEIRELVKELDVMYEEAA